MKLVTQIRFGIRILLDLAMNQKDGMVQMRDIAALQKTSLKYLERLVLPFRDTGFVESRQGRSSGYCLTRSPKDISLAEIIRVFEKGQPHEDSSGDYDDAGYLDYQNSLIQQAWERDQEAFYSQLDRVSLADLSLDTTKKIWSNSDLLIFI